MLRPPTTSEGSTGITTSHPSNQQSAIRERLGDSLVSMIRRYRGGGGGVTVLLLLLPVVMVSYERLHLQHLRIPRMLYLQR